MALQPCERARERVAQVVALPPAVAAARVDDQLGLAACGDERLVQLTRLAGRRAAVVGAVEDQRRRARAAGSGDRRARDVRCGRVGRVARQEQLVEGRDLARVVEAEPVGDARERDRGGETVALRDRPRRHEAAVGDAADRHARRIGDTGPLQRVDAAQQVVQVLPAEIAEVRSRERLSAPGAAARVRQQHRAAGVADREREPERTRRVVERPRVRGAAVDEHDERERRGRRAGRSGAGRCGVGRCGIGRCGVGRQQQDALDLLPVACAPGEPPRARHRAAGERGVDGRQLAPRGRCIGAEVEQRQLRRLARRLLRGEQAATVGAAGRRDGARAPERRRAAPQLGDDAVAGEAHADPLQPALAGAEQRAVVQPAHGREIAVGRKRRRPVGGRVGRGRDLDDGRDAGDLAAIAREALDERHAAAVGGERRRLQLPLRHVQRPRAAGDEIEQRDARVVPGALARLVRDDRDRVAAVPVDLPDVQRARADRAHRAAGQLDAVQPPPAAAGPQHERLVGARAGSSRRARASVARRARARVERRILRHQHQQLRAIARPAQLLDLAGQPRDGDRGARGRPGVVEPEQAQRRRVGGEGEPAAVGREARQRLPLLSVGRGAHRGAGRALPRRRAGRWRQRAVAAGRPDPDARSRQPAALGAALHDRARGEPAVGGQLRVGEPPQLQQLGDRDPLVDRRAHARTLSFPSQFWL